MKKYYSTIKISIPILLIVGFILFSFVPTFYEWGNRWKIKPIRHFELVHNFPTDYNLYLSKIRLGKEGAWLATEKYTAEPHQGSLSQILYVIIGRVSDWVKVQTPYLWFSYHVMRFFFSALLLFVIWHLVSWVFPQFSWRILSFLLIVTASTWPKFETVEGWPRFGGYMPWYTMVDSLQRTTFMPHVMFGQAMLAFIIWVFAGGFVTKHHPGNWMFLGFIGVVLGIIFPPALFFLYGMLALWSFVEVVSILWNERLHLSRLDAVVNVLKVWGYKKLFGRAVFVVMTFPTMIYYALLLSQYPWKRLVEFDVINPTKFSYVEYFLALGPTLLFGVIGILAVLFTRKHSIGQKLPGFVVWVIAWLLFIFIFNFIPQQSPTRFSQMVSHIPLGILTAYLFYSLIGLVAKMQKNYSEAKKNQSPSNAVSNTNLELLFSVLFYSCFIIPISIVLFGLGSMFSSWLWQKDFVDHKLRADYPLVPTGAQVMYPLKDLAEAMIWLQVNTPRSAVIFSGKATGNMIPVYAGNTTHVGHANTVISEIKEIAVANVYGRKVPSNIVEDYFRQYKIAYVIYGPEEVELAFGARDLREFYPFLQEVYANQFAIIYKVNL